MAARLPGSTSSSTQVSNKKRFFKSAPRARDGSTPLPQTIAHRGFKARYPENSLAAFRGALEAGSHGIETDLQLSRDGVVVISHDPTLKRCFGIDKLIADCNWDYLGTLRTIKEPHEKLLRLSDLLEYLDSPEAEHAWVLLDIKINNDPTTMVREISRAVNVAPSSSRPWSDRIVLGCWGPTFFPLCEEHLPGFATALISPSVFSARHVLKTEQSLDVSFNTLVKALQGPTLGYDLIGEAHAADRLVFAWTVNKSKDMRWAIRQRVDAVLTDDPAAFRRICDEWDANEEQRRRDEDRFTVLEHVQLVLIAVLVTLFGWMIKYRYLWTDRLHRRRRLAADENPAHVLMPGDSGEL